MSFGDYSTKEILGMIEGYCNLIDQHLSCDTIQSHLDDFCNIRPPKPGQHSNAAKGGPMHLHGELIEIPPCVSPMSCTYKDLAEMSCSHGTCEGVLTPTLLQRTATWTFDSMKSAHQYTLKAIAERMVQANV